MNITMQNLLHYRLGKSVSLFSTIADEIESLAERFAADLTLELATIHLQKYSPSTNA